MLVYHALHQTGGGTRQGTVDFIANQGWWTHAAEDYRPYPDAGTNEHCWRILIAYGRKDAFDEGHLFDFDEKNHWKLNREGEEEYSRVLSYFRQGKGDVAQGYLWTPLFKKILDPRYAETSADAKRPKTIYTGYARKMLYRWLLDQL
jgi:hypothetical protein